MISKLENYRYNLSLIGITIDEVLLLDLYQNLPADVQTGAKIILLPIAAKEGVVYGMDNITGDLVPFNFSRSSSATLFDKDKNMELVGNNIPRIDYGNYTDDVKLLVEKESTNLIPYSGNGNYVASGVIRCIYEGDRSISSILPDTKMNQAIYYKGNYPRLNQISGLSPTSQYKWSFYLKGDSSYNLSLTDYPPAETPNPIISITPDWKRYSKTMPLGRTSSILHMYSNSKGLFAANIQLETQEVTSYIPTTTTTATRAADLLTYTLPASSGIYLKTNKQNTLLNKPKGVWNIHEDLNNEGIEALAIFYEDIIIGFDEETAVEEFIIPIRDKNQVVKARYALKDTDIEKNTLMGEHYIEISFALDISFKFVRSDYIIWEGEKYIIKEDYIPDEVNKCNYKYTLRFDYWTTLLQDDTFYYMNQGLEEAEWSLMSNAATHFQLLADNANRYFGVNTFNVGTIEFTELKYLRFDKVSIWDAATQIAEEYGGEWYLTGTTFHLVKKFSYGSEIDLESEVSVEKMERSKGENSEKYTRILAFGSTRNIPANYRETTPGEAVDAIYQKRLRIPASKGKFIDAKPNMSPEEIKSAVVIFEKVYPKRIGTMSSITTVEYTDTDTDTGVVTKWNAYRYKDTGLQFKKEYEMPGVELRIAIQSGTTLNGLDFAVKFNPLGKPETDPDSQLFEIVRNEDYGKALPNDTLKPQNGDTYILYGFNIQLVSDQYVPAGEQELYDTAVEWQQDMLKDKSVFECPTMIQHFADNEMDLEIGQKVKLIHDQFEGGFRSSRIQGYEKHLLNKYKARYIVGDNATVSWAKSVDNSIKELQIAGITYQATGKNGVYLITQFDNTPASDFNAYSAKASDTRYLNKQTGGTVQGDVLFQKKIKAKEAISDQFGNETFTSGQFGNGFRTWLAANGQSYAEFDNLMVRREMIINTLTIAEIKSVGGQILLSLANMYCNAVTDGGSYWKCSFDTSNGTIANQFAVDDQVICRKFNGANIKYYWARVTSVGTDYINISKTDKDGAGVPAVNDEIIQFGNRTNSARRSAIILSAYGSDAPSFKQYAGINSYNMTGKEVTVISPSGNKFTGDFTIQSSGTNVTTAITNAQNAAISTAATDATNKVSAIQVGGRNLLLNSKTAKAGSTYNIGTFISSRDFIVGEVLTVTIKGNIPGDKLFGIWFNGGLYYGGQIAKISDGLYSAIKTVPAQTSNRNVGIYLVGNQAATDSWEFEWIKLETGNKRTDWTEAPEDVQARITTAQSAADTANAGLLSKVAYSEYNAQMQVLNTQISSKVSQTDFNALGTRVSSTESSITQQAGQISSVVQKVDNIQIGIRNYVLDSKSKYRTGKGFIVWGLSDEMPLSGKFTLSFNGISTNGGTGGGLGVSFTSNPNGQQEYYFWLPSQPIGESNQNITIDLTRTSVQKYICIYSNDLGRFDVNKFSIISGNKKTDWIPAPEDTQSQIDSKTRTYYQDAQPTAPSGGFSVGDIWQKVTLTDTTGVVNMDSTKNVCRFEYRWNGTAWVQINFNVSGSYVTQTNESISSLVTKTGINGLGTGETLKSLIDQTPDKITLAVSAIQIGGRNLIPNTNQGVYGWAATVQTGTVTYTEVQQQGVRAVKATTSGFTSGYHVLRKNINRSLLQNQKQYTLSLDLFCEFSTTASFLILAANGTNQLINFGSRVITANTWVHIELTAISTTNTGTDQYLYITGFNQNASVTFANIKLEEGNKATTWSPAIEDTQSQIDGKTTLAEVQAGITINSDGVTAFGNRFKVDNLLIANAIETNGLNVGNGNCVIAENGELTAKGANIEGALKVSGNNQITVADASGNTRVTIKPTNITPRANIGGQLTNAYVNTGGAAASDLVTNQTKVWYGQTFTLPAGKVYDLTIPAITIGATVRMGSSDLTYAKTSIRLRNTTTNAVYMVASIEAIPREDGGGETSQSVKVNNVVAGNWRIEIEIMAITDIYSGTAYFSVPSQATIQIIPLSQFTEMGLDGFLTALSSTKYLHVTTDGVYISMDPYILRITSAGISKSANNGATWTNL